MAKRKDFVARYDYVTKEAKRIDEATSSRERVYFDYFNPNGAAAIFNEAYDRLRAAVESPISGLKNGALIAYDGEYYLNNLRRVVMRKSNPGRFESTYFGKELINLSHRIDKVISDAHDR